MNYWSDLLLLLLLLSPLLGSLTPASPPCDGDIVGGGLLLLVRRAHCLLVLGRETVDHLLNDVLTPVALECPTGQGKPAA
jgi:hypothetical protein